MKFDCVNEEELARLQENLHQREKEERIAAGTITSEILSQLNISIEALPLRCQHLLQQCSSLQAALDLDQLDPIGVSMLQSDEYTKMMAQEYEVLELRQENQRLQRQIDRNNKIIQELKRELQASRDSLSNQNPSPDNIQEHTRQLKQKLASYEDIYEKAKAKFAKLHVPDGILPQSLEELSSRLAGLKEEEDALRQRAEDITLARQARDTLNKLRRV